MIRFDNVSKRYPGGYEALSNVSFDMQSGAMAFLTGHSVITSYSIHYTKLYELNLEASVERKGSFADDHGFW